MGGIYAFLGGILTLILAFFMGKRKGTEQTKTKISGQIVIEQQKAEKAEKEKDLVVDAAKIVRENTAEAEALDSYFNDFEEKLTEARSEGNAEYAIEAAKVLFERAENWKQRNIK